MSITIHIISENLTKHKKIKIYEKINTISELLDYITKYDIVDFIEYNNYNVFYNNNEISELPQYNDDISIIIRVNKNFCEKRIITAKTPML
jgi:hypothetical protein